MEVLSAIVSGVVTKLVEYAVAPVGRQVGYVIQYNSNLHNLRTKVQNLKDRRQHIVDVNRLTQEVDELTGEVDTFLENEGHAKTKCFHGFCPNPVLYYQLSKKAKEMVQKIEPYEKTEFPPQEICSVPSQDHLAFGSRISVVKEIMKELRNTNTKKIGVWGVGGVGKTTLAKEVYRQANEEKLFAGVVILVDVKNYSDSERIQKEKYIERIQNEIAEKLDIDISERRTEKGRARHLWDKLKEKKILVILDDVWERIELEVVGIPPTCNILFTSRSREVLFSKMDIQKEFCLHTLRQEESWILFEKMAGGVVKEALIREKAIQLSKKCGGLPILIVTVARALRNSSSLHEWKDALRRLKKLDMKNSEEKPLLTLEWSYNQLDSEELKSLFLVCGILAMLMWHNVVHLDYCFKYSMGLGLLKNVDTMEEAQDAFHSLIKKLQNYCLLEHLDGKNYVRMHELLCNVAIRIARRDKHALLSADEEEFKTWPGKDFFRKCTLICLRQSKMPKLPQVPWECRELKLLIFDCYHDSVALPCNFFEDMKKLRVLDLSALPIPSLPSSLQFLTNLQTLCLDRCALGDISLVAQLRNLEILSILESKIKQLPEEIGQLTHLRLLDLTGCSELVLIPPNVLSSLKSLEDLRMGGNSFRQWEAEGIDGSKRTTNASLSELEQLSKLTALDIHIPDARVLQSGLFLHLERYHVFIGEEWKWLSFDNSFNTLKLKLATSNQLDSGLEMLVNRSEHLYLDVLEGVDDIFHLLNSDGYQQLKHLEVQNNAEITYVINHNVFQKLQSLTLMNLPKLVRFSSNSRTVVATTPTDEQLKTDGEYKEIILENEIGSPVQLFKNGEIVMPNLTILIVHKCDGLRFLLSSSMAKSLVQLKHLEVHNCQIMEEIVSTKESGEEMTTDDIFCKLNHLQLQHLPQLTRFCVGNYIEFPSLEILHLEDCTKLETFIFDHAMIKSAETDSKDNLETPGPYFLFDDKVGFPRLERLIIYALPKLITIWHNQLPQDSFCRLRKVDVQRCHNLINIFAASIMKRLNALDTLQICNCKSIQVVFELGGINVERHDDPSTTQMRMSYCQNLDLIEIDSCESLKNILPVSVAKGLEQLRKLSVTNCDGVEAIVAKEGQETTPNLVFPKATSVTFYSLLQIKCFYNGRHTSKWPLLKELWVNACPNVDIFASEFSRFQENLGSTQPFFLIEKNSFPNLEYLGLGGTKLEIWDGPLPAELFTKLKHLAIASSHFKSSDAFLQKLHNQLEILEVEETFLGEIHAVGTQLRRLRSLKLFGGKLSMLMHLGKENSQLVVIPKLEILEVEHCVRLQNLRSSAISFQNLTTLKVNGCHGLQYLTSCSIAQSLVQLTHMEVKDCQNLMEIVAGNQDDAGSEIAFTRLQHLELSALPSLQRFCCGNCLVKVPSLDTLVVADCLVKLSISPDRVLLTDFNPERFLQNFNNLDNLVLHGDHKEIFFHEENSGDEIHAVVTLPHLTSLKLSEMNMLMHLGKENSQPIIPNLEILEVSLCGKLKNLSSPAISFQNLKTLKAIGCQGLEYLITSSIARSLMQLTHLEVKDCERLVQIVGSSSEDEARNEIAFNKLEHLELSGLPSLQCFFSGAMLSHQFTICDEIEESGDTKENLDGAVQYFLFDKKVGLPRLETLIVHDLHKLMRIWHEQLAPDSFCRLKTVDVQRCSSLINIFGASILGRLNALDTLKLRQCQSLRLVFEHVGINAEEEDDTSITPSKLPEYCQNLVSVKIDSCESLRNIFPASVARGLQQLRKLSVENCVRVEDIVAMEGLGMTTPEFVFPNATSVIFQNLPRLSSFYPGMHASVWPLLKELRVMSCDNVEIFALCFVGTAIRQPLFLIEKGSFSNLEILHFYSKVGTMKNWWSRLPAEFFSKLNSLGSQSAVFQSGFLQNLPHLEYLTLYGFEKEVFVHEGISSGQIQAVGTLLPHLKSLWVFDMPELMHLGKENCQSVIPNLEFLDVWKCEKLKNLRSSAISFQNLKTLKVEKCHGLEYLTTYSIAQSLTQLEEMEVKDCEGLIEIVASNQDDDDAVNEILFMRLQRLELSGLPSLQGFCSGKCIVNIPFLDTLTVTECLIELKISPEKVLLSNSKPERLKLIEEEAKDHDKPEGSGTTRTQAT
ncbi:uncharacterized protein LOC133732844 [Rosa rugosa]|uniref:uncharacterized protein LOC133732844 n=1 Tax=Rosa rugosa TaxID=74645 RepID=UPI002B412535|nr:uncharacterized protein LOC133732844 [Rosa rugosa]XP_062016422.1 uncharacterized protein LOC133732844 [Rosa rugosa]XP_062016423.1 uncharacterized protein LOC133732844 [Rosa rugosa]XP_062016424.1 uncharacterized protein LOC133732844 [Rosa rugosa]XP_062016425.1 uncharacterized protein LOC133732844 [Rosa rugosa]